ncbi:hypothetical protein IFDJLNFL_5613 [Methylobacterium dankookense]|uniref:Uncharacterized protein n=1 Tax=Methylobacterium dankookense TaxID=560405 RepID=A0ABQ4RPE6_9HYPH|nr:hypothetical protein IFDJLNFL_5613 [Methylobacterium dankookense]
MVALPVLEGHVEADALRTDGLVRTEEMDLVVARQGGDLVGADAGGWTLAQKAPRLIDEAVRLGDVGEDAPVGGRAVVGLQRADELGLEVPAPRIDESCQRLRPGRRDWFARKIVGQGEAKLVTASAALNELHAAHHTWSRST